MPRNASGLLIRSYSIMYPKSSKSLFELARPLKKAFQQALRKAGCRRALAVFSGLGFIGV